MSEERTLKIKVEVQLARTTPDGFHCDANPPDGDASWLMTIGEGVQFALCEKHAKKVMEKAIIE